MTLVGPHRDEVRFLIDDVDAGVYGSRGQQRTAALALKLAEVELMHRETGEQPVLLLDDILSELDARRRHFVLNRLNEGLDQALVTATDLHVFPPEFLGNAASGTCRWGTLRRATRNRAGWIPPYLLRGPLFRAGNRLAPLALVHVSSGARP